MSAHDSHGPLCGHRVVHPALAACSTPCGHCGSMADRLRSQLSQALDGDAQFAVADRHIREAHREALTDACKRLDAKGEHHAATALALLVVQLPQAPVDGGLVANGNAC